MAGLVVAPALEIVSLRADDATSDPAGVEFFEKKVRPILVERCVSCHGVEKQQGGLRLDSTAGIRAGGDQGSPILPGQVEESLLTRAVAYTDEDFQMPPTGKIPDAEIQILQHWIRSGGAMPSAEAAVERPKAAFSIAERKNHWSYQPIARPVPPLADGAEMERCESPIDLFLVAARKQRGLGLAPRTSRWSWLRRVTFDLTGLPPTTTDVQGFLDDARHDAMDRTVDRLLASPRYGERWGRHWLDLVRYAESLGHEFDYDIFNAWRYRDYVVRALNRDLPYNQWVVEHVAGDLLSEPRRDPITGDFESPIGTAFFWFGEATHSPVDVRQNQTDRIDNQIDVLTKTFLAQSVACARCHDHKFDAISQADYYALAGYLKSSRYDQASLVPPARAADQARVLADVRVARDQAIDTYLRQQWNAKVNSPADWKQLPVDALPKNPTHPLSPWKDLSSSSPDEFNRAWNEYREKIAAMAVTQRSLRPKWGEMGWRETGDAFVLSSLPPKRWRVALGDSATLLSIPSRLIRSDEHSIRWEGTIRSPSWTIDADFIHVRLAGRGCRVNLVVDGFTILRDPIYGGLTHRIDVDDLTWKTFDVRKWVGQRAYLEVIDSLTPNPTDGFDPASATTPNEAFFAFEQVVCSSQSSPPRDRPHSIVFRVMQTQAGSPEDLARAYQAILDDQQNGDDAHDLLAAMVEVGWLKRDVVKAENPDLWSLLEKTAQLERSMDAAVPRRTPAFVDGTGEDETLLYRGNTKTPGEPVSRRFLEVLSSSTMAPLHEGSGRLSLAEQMADPSNPLTARVMVNRLWKHHLGEGIVRSADDFGQMGRAPTHPDLLDWLAQEFVERGWSMKEMHRTILSSDAAQLSSEVSQELLEQDPNNDYLCRHEVRRLEAEAIRDAILHVSGRLDDRMEGPGVMPMLTEYMPSIGRPGVSGPLDGAGRRSIYLAIRRNFLNPMLLSFDYPLPQTTIGRRNVSNVPAQALSLLNDPMVIEQARLWGREMARRNGSTGEKIVGLYWSAFGREPSAAELARLVEFVDSKEDASGEEDRWSLVCHSMINAKEFIFIP